MACEPIPNCSECEDDSTLDVCERMKILRCKWLSQLDVLACSPNGPIQMEGLKYESKSAAMEGIRKMIEWSYSMCSEHGEGPSIEYSSAVQCNGRCSWWGTSHE